MAARNKAQAALKLELFQTALETSHGVASFFCGTFLVGGKNVGGFPEMEVAQNGWLVVEEPRKWMMTGGSEKTWNISSYCCWGLHAAPRMHLSLPLR